MNTELVCKGFSKSLESYSSNASPQKDISRKLFEYLNNHYQAIPDTVLEIGCGTGFLTSHLIKKYPEAQWYINDLCENVKPCINKVFEKFSLQVPNYLYGNAEIISFPPNLDLIASSSVFQWFNDLPGFLKNISTHCSAEGIFAFSTFGPSNMKEIREITSSGLNYHDIESIHKFLSPYFKIVFAIESIKPYYFPTSYDVLKHIKATGVNGAFRQKWTRSHFNEFNQKYQLFQTEKGMTLTYHPIFFICKVL